MLAILPVLLGLTLKYLSVPNSPSNPAKPSVKMSSFIDALPPDLFDRTTLISLASTVVLLVLALLLSRLVLDPKATPSSLRFLFIWHAFDALIHFCLEGSFLYHCFFSSVTVGDASEIKGSLVGEGWEGLFPNPHNYLGADAGRVVHGAQAGGENAFAKLWMVYANADRRWAGVDLVGFLFLFYTLEWVRLSRAGVGKSGPT